MQQSTKSADPPRHRERDSISLKILGAFFTVMALLVLTSILWSLDNFRAVVGILICGGMMLMIGLGMWISGQKIARDCDRDPESLE